VGVAADEAEIDARLLAEHLLGWDAARFFASADAPPPEDFSGKYGALVDRRARREPIAYITGRQEFWGLTFDVKPAVLIPRPETELVVEIALELYADPALPMPIADVCTGSGCIAVAIASERPQARIIATDISQPALQVAAKNAAKHGVDARVRFVRTSLLDNIADRFRMIVANPPYVPNGDRPALPPEVRDHEPMLALLAGSDGLDVIRGLLAQAGDHLHSGGALVFEIGYGQSDAVSTLISITPGLTMVDVRNDLQGIPRTVIVRRD